MPAATRGGAGIWAARRRKVRNTPYRLVAEAGGRRLQLPGRDAAAPARIPVDNHEPRLNRAVFRFYQELSDFLPAHHRKRSFEHEFRGNPSVKDTIEALGVPHAEVDLVLVNGRSVGFGRKLHDGDRVAVYPVFESFDIGDVTRLRPRPLRQTRFVLDVHLGRLARLLRLLGLDTVYHNDLDDARIVRIALAEQRVILTRDIGILKRSEVTHGYWVRSQEPIEQAKEVVRRFDLTGAVEPFTRCARCNGLLEPVDKSAVREELPAASCEAFDEFYRCRACGKLYWKGSHYTDLRRKVEHIVGPQS